MEEESLSVTPDNFFEGILNDYWEKLVCPRIDKLTVDSSEEFLKEMLDISNDKDVCETKFDFENAIIEGNDKICSNGTIVDVYRPEGSMIYPTYKKYKCILENLKYELDKEPVNFGRVGCKKYCIGCENRDTKKCVAEMKKLKEEMFKVGGTRDKILKAVAEGNWKAEDESLINK